VINGQCTGKHVMMYILRFITKQTGV